MQASGLTSMAMLGLLPVGKPWQLEVLSVIHAPHDEPRAASLAVASQQLLPWFEIKLLHECIAGCLSLLLALEAQEYQEAGPIASSC